MNLILVGRNVDRLEQVRMEICALYESTEVKIVSFDLSGDLATGIVSLREAVLELDVGVLVNNAGLVEPSVTYFHEADISAWMEMVRVNLEALAEITHAVLPLMLKRKKCAIVNISSLSGIASSFPLNTVYASTKSFVAQFSQSLYVEYKSKGIDVQCQVPFLVSTKMVSSEYLKRKQFFLTIVDPDTYALAAMRCIGYDRTVIPNASHFLQWRCIASLPDFLMNNFVLNEALKLIDLQRT